MDFDPKAYLNEVSDAPDEDIDLARAAVALAALQQPDLSLERYFNHLKKLCEETAARHKDLIDSGAQDDADTQLAAFKYVLVDMHGYEGDQERYDDIENASLIRAIDRGKGMPITLSLLYIHVGKSLGWDIAGLDIPGHFVCRLERGGQRVIFDPFHGCEKLEAPDLRALVKKIKGNHAELSAEYFEAAPARSILIRLQNNIKYRQIEAEDYQGALSTVESMRLIDPKEYRLLLDAGVLYARTEQTRAAIDVLEDYIKLAPHDRDRHDAALLLQQLKESLN